jgi:hypothetical protein
VANEELDIEDVLTTLSMGSWSGYCLAHMFTSREFSGQ